MTKALDEAYQAAGSFRHGPPDVAAAVAQRAGRGAALHLHRPQAWPDAAVAVRWGGAACVKCATYKRPAKGDKAASRAPKSASHCRCKCGHTEPAHDEALFPVGCHVKVTTWPGNPGRSGERPAAFAGVVEAWDAANGQHTVRDGGDGSLKLIFLCYCTDAEVLSAASAPAAAQPAGGVAAPRRGARRTAAAAQAESPTQPTAHAAPPRARAAGRRVGRAAGAAEAGTAAGGMSVGATSPPAPKPRAKRSAQGGAAKGAAATGGAKRARRAVLA
jgi:hypothetical protein